MTAIAWHLQTMLAFDTETTGVDVEADRIVTVSTVRIVPGKQTVTWQQLVDPGIEIPEAAIAVHGVTTEQARTKGKKPPEVLDLVAADLAIALNRGIPVVGMNVSYDLTILDRECRRHGVATICERLGRGPAPVVDVLVVDKQVDPYRKGKRRLENLCETYRVAIDGAHDAAFDAIAAARVAWRIGEMYPQIAEMPLAELHAAQVGWRAEQCASLQAYFRRTDPDAVVDGRWPLIPYTPEQAEGVA